MALGKIAATLLSTGLLAGSALAQETPAAPPLPPAPAAAPAAAPANTGRLYIAYPQQPHADYPSHLAIDDVWFSDTIAPNACIYFDLPAGGHTLRTVADPKLNFELAAGGTKYVELRVRHTYVGGASQDDIFPKSADTLDNLAACKPATAP